MAALGFELLFRFLWGGALLLTIVSRRETTERFPRIAAWIVTVTALFAGWLAAESGLPDARVFPGLVMVVGGMLLYAYTVPRFTRTVGFLLYALAPLPWLAGRPFGEIVNFATSGLLLGAIFAGQYLGHWFLTVAGLPIGELQKVVRVLFVALGLRTVEVAYTLFVRVGINARFDIDSMGRTLPTDLTHTASMVQLNPASSLLGLHGEQWFGLGFFGALILLSRLLWGILAPWILSVMVKKTVDTRSTQSATGILYALSVMIILGEGAAIYFKNTLNWWI